MPIIDLHTHSTASDGTLTPTQLINQAHREGIRLLAITDHDTIAGLKEGAAAGEANGVQVIRGLELSVNYEDGSLHLLGYGIDSDHPDLIQILETLCQARLQRNDRMLAKLVELGYPLTGEEVRRESGGGVLSRAHIARALLHKGYVASYEEAFIKLLNRGAPAYIDRMRLSLREALELVHKTGGVAIWAHPGLHAPERLKSMLKRLPEWKMQGLDGLEADYSGHSSALAEELRRLALGLGLIYTGGSDFHGEIKPHIRLGFGPEGCILSKEVGATLMRKLNQDNPF